MDAEELKEKMIDLVIEYNKQSKMVISKIELDFSLQVSGGVNVITGVDFNYQQRMKKPFKG